MLLNNRKLKKKSLALLRKAVLISAMVIVGFFLLVLILTPLRNWGARKYLSAGDQKLLKLEYVPAEIEYQKASVLTPFDANIRLKIELVENSETDITRLRNFVSINDQRSTINDFKAIDDLNDPVALTQLAKTFIDRNQPQMAVVAAQKANKLKANYRDGLLYLAKAYDLAARVGTIRQSSYDNLIAKSQEAYENAVKSDPSYFAEFPASP